MKLSLNDLLLNVVDMDDQVSEIKFEFRSLLSRLRDLLEQLESVEGAISTARSDLEEYIDGSND
mgnify:CR=1 FL=1